MLLRFRGSPTHSRLPGATSHVSRPDQGRPSEAGVIRRPGCAAGALLLVLGLPLAGCAARSAAIFDDLDVVQKDDNFHAIEHGVAYRSAQLEEASLRGVIAEFGIRTVINLRGADPGEQWYTTEKTVCAELDVAHIDIRMSGFELPERATLLRLVDTFQTAAPPLLIHCKAGADRTGAAAGIWRMVMQGATNAEAARELDSRYGHFKLTHPEMDRLVALFKPNREWILRQYQD